MTEENKVAIVSETAMMSEDPITLSPNDLQNATEWEDFISLWMVSKDIDMRNQWFKGDIANRVAIVHGEGSLSKFALDVQEKRVTVESYRRVARAFPREDRNLNLSWTHYFLASFTDSYNKGESKFDSKERYQWIEKANDESWSTTRLSAEIKKNDAMKEGEQSIYAYYDDYLMKVSHVLLHIEKSQLTRQQANSLLAKIKEIQGEFITYLADVT